MARQTLLVCQHLENISCQALEKYQHIRCEGIVRLSGKVFTSPSFAPSGNWVPLDELRK